MESTVWTQVIAKYVPSNLTKLLFYPNYHAGEWHEFSLMRHFSRVLESAHQLYYLTGIDVVREAEFHDVGKLTMFEKAVNSGDYNFIGHEAISADIAAEFGMSGESQLVICHHNISYMHKPENVVNKLCGGDPKLTKRMLVLATADTSGKGWVPSQKKQRPEVAAKFEEICQLAGLDDLFAQQLKLVCLER